MIEHLKKISKMNDYNFNRFCDKEQDCCLKASTNYFKNLILYKLFCKLETLDVDGDSFDFDVYFKNIIIECYVVNANKTEDGYSFKEVYVKKVFDKENETYIDWKFEEKVNEKLFKHEKI